MRRTLASHQSVPQTVIWSDPVLSQTFFIVILAREVKQVKEMKHHFKSRQRPSNKVSRHCVCTDLIGVGVWVCVCVCHFSVVEQCC